MAVTQIPVSSSDFDIINGKLYPSDRRSTIAKLREISGSDPAARVKVDGYWEKGDGAFADVMYIWDKTSTADDNGGTVIALNDGSDGRYILQYSSNVVNPRWFGAVPMNNGEAVEDAFDSTEYLLKANASLKVDEVLGDGKDIFRIKVKGDNNDTYLGGAGFNLELRSAEPATFGRIQNGKDFDLRLGVDGNRGNFTETWVRMMSGSTSVSMSGTKSMQPQTGNFITSDEIDEEYTINLDVRATNMFNTAVVRILTHGKIIVNGWQDDNIANKPYHFWHGGDEGGGVFNQWDTGMTVFNCTPKHGENGILPDSFTFIDNLGTGTDSQGNADTTDMSGTITYGSANMPQPQGAFGGIVTFGHLRMIQGAVAGSYASTAFCSDRNISAEFVNVECKQSNEKSTSNNPAGMFWTEQSEDVKLKGFRGEITGRSENNTGDESILSLWCNTGQKNTIVDAEVKTNDYDLTRPVRCSSSGGAEWEFDRLRVYGNGHKNEHVVSLNYFTSVTEKDTAKFTSCEFEGTNLTIAPMKELRFNDCHFNISGETIQSYDRAVTNIEDKTDLLVIDGGTFDQRLTLWHPVGTLIVTGGAVFKSHLNIMGKVDTLIIGDDVVIEGRLLADPENIGVSNIQAQVTDEATSNYESASSSAEAVDVNTWDVLDLVPSTVTTTKDATVNKVEFSDSVRKMAYNTSTGQGNVELQFSVNENTNILLGTLPLDSDGNQLYPVCASGSTAVRFPIVPRRVAADGNSAVYKPAYVDVSGTTGKITAYGLVVGKQYLASFSWAFSTKRS